MDESSGSDESDDAEEAVLDDSEPPLDNAASVNSFASKPQTQQTGGIGSMSRAGLGAPSRPSLGQAPVSSSAVPDLPSAFASAAKRQPRSFLNLNGSGKPSPSSTPKPPPVLTNDERRHFAKLENAGGMGFKLLSKMGWNSGSGLGANKEGRINPVDQQLRPRGMGIGHDGYKEKTKGSILEAKRCVDVFISALLLLLKVTIAQTRRNCF